MLPCPDHDPTGFQMTTSFGAGADCERHAPASTAMARRIFIASKERGRSPARSRQSAERFSEVRRPRDDCGLCYRSALRAAERFFHALVESLEHRLAMALRVQLDEVG